MKKLLISAIVFLVTVITAQANYKEHLKAHWDFETTKYNILLDVSGNKENGEIIGNPEIVPGVVGKCMRFNGDDYIKLYKRIKNHN